MSFDITKLLLTLENIAGSDRVILISVRNAYVYEDNKRTDKISGILCECICCDNHYLHIRVLVDSSTVTQDMIDKAENPIYIGFQDFKASVYKQYRKEGEPALSCKASSIRVLK